MSLQEICRIVVRRIVRKNIQLEHPSLNPGSSAKRRPARPRRPRRCDRRRRINFIPMQASDGQKFPKKLLTKSLSTCF